MKGWLKRVRGAIGVGVTWAAGWGLGGGLIWLTRTFSEFGFDVALVLGGQYALIGFLGGVTFSAILRFTDGRRRFDELRIPKFAGWGGLGGLLIGGAYIGLLSVLFGQGFDAPTVVEFLGITTLFGAGSASGSLAIARIADDRELLEESEEAADVGLSETERQALLGDPDAATS